jgi:signal transduction histidine kinase
VPAVGDSLLVGIAIENLVANALRAAGEGRVRVAVELRGRAACLVVEDDGPGIQDDLTERVFEPFFTTHATGTGLGLAVVRKVIRAHHGEVRAERSPLGGARFEFQLPSEE